MLERCEPRGFHAGVQAVCARGREDRPAELKLRQRLAAGERHAAAGGFVKGAILEHLGEDFLDGGFASDNLQRPRVTPGRAFAADDAGLAVELVLAIFYFVGSLGTECHAGLAADALAGSEEDLAIWRPALRVMAPEAVQRTTFQKYRRADARTILDREPLDLEYATFHEG